MITRNKTAKAFALLLERMGRSEVGALLGDWNGSELSEDGTKILWNDERSGAGQLFYSANEFFEWLFSDEPLDTAQYTQDEEWTTRIKQAREIAESV